jgi:hypothetical protein
MFAVIKGKFPYLLITLLIGIVVLSRQLTLCATDGQPSVLTPMLLVTLQVLGMVALTQT